VPVHQNLLYKSATAAKGTVRGDLAMTCCRACGFVFNAAFDADLLEYGPDYDNSQQYSPSFAAHIERLVERLLGPGGVRGRRLVEIGCGKGGFLRLLVEAPGSGITGIGFDPAFVGDTRPLPTLEYRREFYGADSRAEADAALSRHVIEHIPRPVEFLETIHRTLPVGGRLFLETPCVDWILSGRVVWDFFYEHCSVFSVASLTAACGRAGFAIDYAGHVFNGQYLWIEATAAAGAPNETTHGSVAHTVALAGRAVQWDRAMLQRWHALVRARAATGPVYVWGAGAKGSTFCNLVDPAGEFIAGVVDVNPAKQNAAIAGSAHPIIAPEAVPARSAATVLVLNPNYYEEIVDDLCRRGASAVRVESMETEAAAA
jgi:SAM-dependent methyltransferase